jgi:hypothetical protein
MFSQLVNFVEDDELNVVVCFLDGELYEFPRCSFDCNRVARQSREGGRRLIDNRGRVGFKEVED